MLAELFPRAHARYSSLPVLGPHLDGFVVWLRSQGYHDLLIRLRIRAARRLDALLRRRGVDQPRDLTATDLRAYAPADSQEDLYLAAAVRSLVRYFEQQGALAPPPATPAQTLICSYRTHLERDRGLAFRTVIHHMATVRELLSFLDHDQVHDRLRGLDQRDIEAFVQVLSTRLSRASLQHSIAHLRAFLRFLVARGLVPADLEAGIDTPRVYRGEQLPRALPWETVRALLRAVDRSTLMGRRDYAMLLLVMTYGLRTSEVVALTLDDIDWRSGQLRVPRSKVATPLVLPLTQEVGAALVDYLQHGRPDLPNREIFLRVRAPAGTLKPTALTEAFQGWVRRSGLPIRFQGPHCLRHSLAVHLLRQGTPLKTIGDLLGHRSSESTCVYLRLHVEDLREVALDLPVDAGEEVCR
ncbi:MAG: tyrosine-type recombinase/integrase [Deltaproteobacteria bacterium]|nr:tyrosine-type recombinase/integrase [Deltaproteobacteria bacterium]